MADLASLLQTIAARLEAIESHLGITGKIFFLIIQD